MYRNIFKMNCVLSKGIQVFSSSFKYGMFRSVLLNTGVPCFARISYPKTFGHSSIRQVDYKNNPAARARRKALDNVNWLPFPWSRPSTHNPFEDSGDLVKVLEYDPSWPKPDFELSEELKTANEDVKKIFSLVTASRFDIREVITRKTLERIQRHPNDFDSLEVKIALKTIQIRSVFEHGVKNKKERMGGRYVLNIMIKKRNKLLKTLRNIDTDRFNWLCKELKLKYTPQRLGGPRERWTRKWDLRRLTKEYCTKMINERKAAYHEELKQQQAAFLEEKKEILAWIEKEEKELANLNI